MKKKIAVDESQKLAEQSVEIVKKADDLPIKTTKEPAGKVKPKEQGKAEEISETEKPIEKPIEKPTQNNRSRQTTGKNINRKSPSSQSKNQQNRNPQNKTNMVRVHSEKLVPEPKNQSNEDNQNNQNHNSHNSGYNQNHQQNQPSMGNRLDELMQMKLKELSILAKELRVPRFNRFHKKDLVLEIFKSEARTKKIDFAGGVLEILQEGYGFLRTTSYLLDESDVYVSPSQIRKFGLRTGDWVIGQARPPRDGEGYKALLKIEAVNFERPDKIRNRDHFHKLTPLYPDERIQLEVINHDEAPDLDANALHSLRIVDIITPIGKGQRGLIVSPPKAGKTTLIKQIANAITVNHPEIELMVLLIDERPEEVTDMERSVQGEVVSSTFDMPTSNHIQVTEMVLEKAKRLVEQGKDVVILLDSITRLARAYNINTQASGQTLSGGVNPQALYKPKKFFGSARKLEEGGSLTILATALIETGSRMDEVIFEEFKGTGNMELVLDRKLFEKRIFPSIDLQRSSTRKEELLLDDMTCQRMTMIRRLFEDMTPQAILEMILDKMKSTETNRDFVRAITSRNG